MNTITKLKQPRKTIVICDDDDTLREYLREKITKLNIKIIGEAETGFDSLNMIIDLEPDIILLDIDMPMGNGLDVLRFIRSMDVSARIVMLTGDGSNDTVNEALELGADDFLLKREIVLQKRDFFLRVLGLN